MDLDVERPYRFVGGPWDGRETTQPRAVMPQHCMPNGTDGSTWAAADSWPGQHRYAPDGTDGDTQLMTWRTATITEVNQAKRDRIDRYADPDPIT